MMDLEILTLRRTWHIFDVARKSSSDRMTITCCCLLTSVQPDGYIRRSVTNWGPHRRTDTGSQRSVFLVVTHPSTNRGRRNSTTVRVTELALVATAHLVTITLFFLPCITFSQASDQSWERKSGREPINVKWLDMEILSSSAMKKRKKGI